MPVLVDFVEVAAVALLESTAKRKNSVVKIIHEKFDEQQAIE
jgi:hypothetical protein